MTTTDPKIEASKSKPTEACPCGAACPCSPCTCGASCRCGEVSAKQK